MATEFFNQHQDGEKCINMIQYYFQKQLYFASISELPFNVEGHHVIFVTWEAYLFKIS